MTSFRLVIQCVLGLGLLASPNVVFAWKEVGNAAGISEQNILFAKESGPSLGRTLENQYLVAFAKRLAQVELSFDYAPGSPVFGRVSGNTWKIFAQNILSYDLDRNQYLNLTEAYLLLLDLYQSEQRAPVAIYQQSRVLLENHLRSEERSHFMVSGEHRLQWTEHNVAGDGNQYVIFYPDTNALVLEGVDFQELCPGQISRLKLHTPQLKQNPDRTNRGPRWIFLVGARAELLCDGRPLRHEVILELEVQTGAQTLKLLSFGVLD